MENFKVKYPPKIYVNLTGKTNMEALQDALVGRDTCDLVLDPDIALLCWSKVISCHCPYCNEEVRYPKRSLEELLCEDSISFYGEFQEYCPECGKKFNFPVLPFSSPEKE